MGITRVVRMRTDAMVSVLTVFWLSQAGAIQGCSGPLSDWSQARHRQRPGALPHMGQSGFSLQLLWRELCRTFKSFYDKNAFLLYSEKVIFKNHVSRMIVQH